MEETLRLYRDEDEAIRQIPTLRMICQPYKRMRRKAEKLLKMIGPRKSANFERHLSEGASKVGGGALPLLVIPTCLVCLVSKRLSAHEMETWLRSYDPPIIGRVEKEQVLLDVRTIQDKELKTVAEAIRTLAMKN